MRSKISALLLALSILLIPYLPSAKIPAPPVEEPPSGLYHYMDGYAIVGEIKELQDYGELLLALAAAKPGDNITIYIESPGGDMFVGEAIKQAMEGSKARIWIHCIVCSSAAGYIASGGTDLYLYSESLVLVHLASNGIAKYMDGIIYEVSSAHARHVLERLHLPDTEINSIMLDVNKGVDYWMRASYICRMSTRSIQRDDACYISMR